MQGTHEGGLVALASFSGALIGVIPPVEIDALRDEWD